MASFRFSRLAESDLLSIGEYTMQTWGPEQAARYLDSLEVCCQRLSDEPSLGRKCEAVSPGLRSKNQGKHVIFFRCDEDGILVSRILHQRMLPEKHLTEDPAG